MYQGRQQGILPIPIFQPLFSQWTVLELWQCSVIWAKPLSVQVEPFGEFSFYPWIAMERVAGRLHHRAPGRVVLKEFRELVLPIFSLILTSVTSTLRQAHEA